MLFLPRKNWEKKERGKSVGKSKNWKVSVSHFLLEPNAYPETAGYVPHELKSWTNIRKSGKHLRREEKTHGKSEVLETLPLQSKLLHA